MKKNMQFLFVCIILSFMGLYNKYPYLSDFSGEYVNAGFNKEKVGFNIGAYATFVAHTSWGISLWLVVLCQVFISAYALSMFFKYFIDSKWRSVALIAYCILISLCMSGGLIINTISPFVFSATTILTIIVLLQAENMTKSDFCVLVLIFFVSLTMNIFNVASALLVFVIYGCFLHVRTRRSVLGTRLDNVHLLFSGTVVCLLFATAAYFREFSSIRSLQSYLKTSFKNKKSFSSDFFNQILNIKISTPKRQDEWSSGFKSIYKWFNWESREYMLTRQFQKWSNLNWMNYSQTAIVIFLLVVTIYVITKRGLEKRQMFLVYAALLIYALNNTFAYGSNVQVDLQMFWLLPLPFFVMLFNNSTAITKISEFKSSLDEKFNKDK